MNFEDDTIFLFFAILTGMFKGSVVGLFGYVFIHVLIKPNAVFDFWPSFVHKTLKFSGNLNVPKWKIKADFMLNHCEKCFAGQLAFWVYLIEYRSIFGLITCFCVAILTARYLYEKNR